MKKFILLGAIGLMCSVILAQDYKFKESPIEYQTKEPSDSKFLRINSLEVKVGELEQRIKDLEDRMRALEASKGP
jgi:TolA-binding protein